MQDFARLTCFIALINRGIQIAVLLLSSALKKVLTK